MSDNNDRNSFNLPQPNPFGAENAFINMEANSETLTAALNNNQQTPERINVYKEILSAKIGFIFFQEKMKYTFTPGGEAAVAKIDEFTEELKDKYIKNWDENVQGKEEFMSDGRIDTKKVEATVTASALAMVASIMKGGRRRRRKKRTKKRRKSRRKSKGRKRRKSRRRKRR